MADRKTVMSWLEGLAQDDWREWHSDSEVQTTAQAALELLTTQSVKPRRNGRVWLCGNCGEYVGFEDHDENDPNEFDNYCRKCGKAVAWSD